MRIKSSNLPDSDAALLMCTAVKLRVSVETVFCMAASDEFCSPGEVDMGITHSTRVFNGELFLLGWVREFCMETLGIDPVEPESVPKILGKDPYLKGGL